MANGTALYKDESWLISYSAETRELIFRTMDYHAGPLRVGVDSLEEMLQGIGTGGEARREPNPAPKKQTGLPGDLVALFRRAGYEVGISKKERSLYAAPADGKGSALKISRKEMSEMGKKMNKRVKGTRRKQPG